MKNLSANYTIRTLNSLIGNESLIQKKIADPNRKGLYFQPTKNSLTVIFRFQKDGKNFQMKIGSYPSMPLQDIYSKFSELRQELDNEINPVLKQKEQSRLTQLKNKYTLNYVFEDFMDNYIYKARKRPEEFLGHYNCHVREKLGDMVFEDINLIHCRDLIDSIKGKRAPHTIYQLLKQCWIHQHGRGFLEPQATNPFLILKPPVLDKRIRDRLITDEEMKILWEKLPTRDRRVELGAKLLVHTACRVGEINSNRWENVDWENKNLIIPKDIDKEGQARLKPLSDQSMELLDELRYITGNQEQLIFINRNVIGKNLRKISMDNNLQDGEGRFFNAHDLRTYFSTNARKIGLDRTIIESYLSHVTEKGASANYAFYDYQDEKRELASKWSNHVDSVVS
jgi:integrase